MPRVVVAWPLDGGGVVLVEVPDNGGGPDRVGRGSSVLRQVDETLQRALGQLKPGITAAMQQLRDAVGEADRVSVTFGVRLTAAAGAVIASAGSEATFAVTAEWGRSARAPEQ